MHGSPRATHGALLVLTLVQGRGGGSALFQSSVCTNAVVQGTGLQHAVQPLCRRAMHKRVQNPCCAKRDPVVSICEFIVQKMEVEGTPDPRAKNPQALVQRVATSVATAASCKAGPRARTSPCATRGRVQHGAWCNMGPRASRPRATGDAVQRGTSCNAALCNGPSCNAPWCSCETCEGTQRHRGSVQHVGGPRAKDSCKERLPSHSDSCRGLVQRIGAPQQRAMGRWSPWDL